MGGFLSLRLALLVVEVIVPLCRRCWCDLLLGMKGLDGPLRELFLNRLRHCQARCEALR